jgi:arylsulfatase A-like enzyme/Tfp pilus assembly protein PilF
MTSHSKSTSFVGLVLVVAIASAGCDRNPAGNGGGAAAPPQAFSSMGAPAANVLFVSVDTTRADHIGCYGNAKAKTPNIDRLAEEGVRFAQCVSAIPLTLPSHSTMMTGSYPFVHGARDNGIYSLPEGNQTLAEILGAAGYTTHAEVAAEVLDAKYGLTQGFEVYGDVQTRLKERIQVTSGALTLDQDIAPVGYDLDDPDVERERPAIDIAEHGLAAMRKAVDSGKPFFVFLHFFDPHWPFKAPPEFAQEGGDGYLAEIAYFDAQFGRLVDFLRESGAADNTLVVWTSDHGEGRGQHGEYTHSSFLFDTTLHVPLIIWAPGRIPGGVVVDSQVRTVDLAPTVLDFVRLPRTPQMQGSSLLPLVERPREDDKRLAYSETMAAKNMAGYSMLRSVRRDGWKYIHAPASVLYHVGEDRMELFNLAEKEAERTTSMRDAMRTLIANAPNPPGGRANRMTASEESLQALEALGYVTSAVAAEDDPMVLGTELDHFPPQGPDPHEHTEEIDLYAVGVGAIRTGDLEAAEHYLRRLVTLQPDHLMAMGSLGHAMILMHRPEEAVEWLEKSIGLDSSIGPHHRMLGVAYALIGEAEQAERAYRKALELDPADHNTYMVLGRLYASEGRNDEAMREYQAAAELSPDNPQVYLAIGRLHRRAGRIDEAGASMRRAIALKPDLSDAIAVLATMIFDQGDIDAALAVLNDAIARKPEDPLLHHSLAVLLLRQEQPDLAIEQFRIAADLLEDNAQAFHNLGAALLDAGRGDEAIPPLEKAVELDAEHGAAWLRLGNAYDATGRYGDAGQAYERVVGFLPDQASAYVLASRAYGSAGNANAAVAMLKQGHEKAPDNLEIANDLAWWLATASDDALRDGAEAVRLARQVVAATAAESCNELDTLAVALAEVGQFDEAVETAERAIAIAQQSNQADLASRITKRLELYRDGKTYHAP